MAMDLINCNVCCTQPSKGIEFFLTNCGHFVCQKCEATNTRGTCKVCSRQCKLSSVFDDNNRVAKEILCDVGFMLKKVKNVHNFQETHVKRLISNLRVKNHQLKTGNSILENKMVKMDEQFRTMIEINKRLKETLKKLEFGSFGSSPSQDDGYSSMFSAPSNTFVNEPSHVNVKSANAKMNAEMNASGRYSQSPFVDNNRINFESNRKLLTPQKNSRCHSRQMKHQPNACFQKDVLARGRSAFNGIRRPFVAEVDKLKPSVPIRQQQLSDAIGRICVSSTPRDHRGTPMDNR